MQQQAPDHFLVKQSPAVQETILALKQIILQHDAGITTAWKFGMPFFYFKGKLFCYLWVHQKSQQPYISFANGAQLKHPLLLQEKRKLFHVMRVDAAEDLPLHDIQNVLQQAIALHQHM